MKHLALVVHNVRSAHNVGSLLRTADGLGVNKVYLTGYTPYPEARNDQRLPHISQKLSKQIHKTALGAQDYLDWRYEENLLSCLSRLADNGYSIVALEQTGRAINLNKLSIKGDIALIVGNEVTGLDQKVLNQVKYHIQIPMLGQKESFNVSVAAAVALYHMRWTT